MIPLIYIRRDPNDLLSSLQKYLPQFMSLPGGTSKHSRILTSFEGLNIGESFVVAYLDYSRGPETEMWLFSSLEIGQNTEAEVVVSESQLVALFYCAGDIEKKLDAPRITSGVVLLGSVHEKVLEVLERKQLIETVNGEPYLKYIFDVRNFPKTIPLPSSNLSWTSVQPEDFPLVLARTNVPRKERTLLQLPSTAVRTAISTSPIAWGFIGPDGSLTSLYCEREYRQQGIAKALTTRLFQDHLSKYSLDGLAHADVAPNNVQSQALCKSLGGTAEWVVYWARVRTCAVGSNIKY